MPSPTPSHESRSPEDASTERLQTASHVLAFRCSRCADCCTGWSVPVDGKLSAAIEARSGGPGPTAGGRLVQSPAADSVQDQDVLAMSGGACVFLTPDRSCELHEQLGHGAKPRACQSYPYRQVRLASTTAVSLDLSCRSAAALLDRPFPPSMVSHERPAAPGVGAPTELIDGLEVEPEIFVEAETALRRTLEMAPVPLEERLLTGSLLLDEVLQDADGGDGDPRVWGWRTELEVAPCQKLRSLLRRARSRDGHPLRQYLLLGRLLDLVEQWLARLQLGAAGGFWSETRRIRELFDIDAETLGWDERGDRFALELTRLWSRRHPDTDRVLGNYLWHSVAARHLTVEHGLVVGFRVLLIHYVLVRLHAAGFAQLEDQVPSVDHAVHAVQVVERNFGHLPLLKRFWKRTSSINLLTDADLASHLLVLPDLELLEGPEDGPRRTAAGAGDGALDVAA